MDADKIRVTVLGISYSHLQQGAYLLLLAEENGSRRVPVVVGKSEAQSIAIRMEKLAPPRPMTHDLMVNISEQFGIAYKEVYIYRFDNGIFYSILAMTDGVKRVEIDARTSDAVAIAMRCDAPIYIEDELLNTLCIKEEWENAFSIPITLAGTDTLREVMQRAIEEENYELAMKLKQELDSRTRNNETGVKPPETMNN